MACFYHRKPRQENPFIYVKERQYIIGRSRGKSFFLYPSERSSVNYPDRTPNKACFYRI